jgi:hypothetical protein
LVNTPFIPAEKAVGKRVNGDREMKSSMSFKRLGVALALATLAFTGSAMAYDDDDRHDRRDEVIGIIGGVVQGAIEAEREKEEAKEQERRCFRLKNRCEDGAEWACEKYEEQCAD